MARMYTERCGIHGPSDELAMLRRELLQLGASPEEEMPQAVDAMRPENGHEVASWDFLVQVNQHTRIHGEPIATRLALEYEETVLQNALLRAEAWDGRAKALDAMMVAEEAARESLIGCEAQEHQAVAASQACAHAAVTARMTRAAVVERQRCAAVELLRHNQHVIDLDAKLLRDEYEWSKLVREEDEMYRKEAEVAMRQRMAAEKRALLPDHDLTTSMPFLLTTFERFLPYA